MRLKQKLAFLCGLIIILIMAGCVPSHDKEKDPNRLQVYTTLYPLEYFTKRIGGEHIQVENLVPVGTDSHEFEPSAKDFTQLAEADLFIHNGVELQPWVEKVEHVMDESKSKRVDTTQSISLLHSESDGDDDHDHHQKNPHVWLDPQLAKKQADQIKQGLIEMDRKNQQLYEKNYHQLAIELDQLDQEFQKVANQKQTNKIVVSHNAFAYLAKRYGLKQIAISGLSPMDEPSPQKLKQIVDTIKKHQLKYIFFETFGTGKLVKTVQKEANVKALSLHPLEGLTKKEADSGEDYFSIMYKNKENLKKALENK